MSLDPLAALDLYEFALERIVFASLCQWVKDKAEESWKYGLDWSGPTFPLGDGGGVWRVLVKSDQVREVVSVYTEKKGWDPFRQGFFWRPAKLWRSRNDDPNKQPPPRHPLAVMFEILSWVDQERTERFGTNDWHTMTNEEGEE
jgi:hypothetical protein